MKSLIWISSLSIGNAWIGGKLTEGRAGLEAPLFLHSSVLEPGHPDPLDRLSALVEIQEGSASSSSPSPFPPQRSFLQREHRKEALRQRDTDREEDSTQKTSSFRSSIRRVTDCSQTAESPNLSGMNYFTSALDFTEKVISSCPSASPMSLALEYTKKVSETMSKFEDPSGAKSYPEQHKMTIEQFHESFILCAVIQNLFWKAEAEPFFSGSGELLNALLDLFGKTFTAPELDLGPALTILSFFLKMREELTKHQFAHADKISDFSNMRSLGRSAFQKPTSQRLDFLDKVASTFALNKTPFCPEPSQAFGLLPSGPELVMKTYGNFNMDIYLDSIKFKNGQGETADLSGLIYSQALEYHIGLLDQVVRAHEGSSHTVERGWVLPSTGLPKSPAGSEILQKVPSLISRLSLAHAIAVSLRSLQSLAWSYGGEKEVVFPIGLAGGHLIRTLLVHGSLDSVPVAIGWTNPNGGHAMMMDLKRKASASLDIEIYNTGGGSGIHGAAEHAVKEGDGRLNTLPYYRIALDPLAEWRDYKHEEEAPESDFVRPQLSGTCTMKSPKVWMKRVVEKKDLWRQLKQEMRRISTRHAINFVSSKVALFEKGQGGAPDFLWSRLLLEGSRDLIRCHKKETLGREQARLTGEVQDLTTKINQIHKFSTQVDLSSLPMDAHTISSEETFVKMTSRDTPSAFQELRGDNAVGAPPSFTLPVPRLWSQEKDNTGEKTFTYIESLYKAEGKGLPAGSFPPKMMGDLISSRLLSLPIPSLLKDKKLFSNRNAWDRLPESGKDVWMQVPARQIPTLIDWLFSLTTESLGGDKAANGKPTERVVAVNLVLAIVWRLAQTYEIQEHPTGAPVVGQYCFYHGDRTYRTSFPFVEFAGKIQALTYDALVQQKMKVSSLRSL
uniref:Uncharacterized protein n=1 Tax=Chromera velia CCMP2878 TaxID=1169474 RepID=A0A0G4G7T9_9ALVE|eukprot:Cvel_20610.t1-p1 / transcript=Cvel_20610.t1 / gene=Cvel_20610 / organism=Chromera_velia_CCMP2878 / gene_product=hypothetical protein / transcript_product=hypothetical protein / location=Cvel_scaffold1865:6487-13284(+) / protein_length=897 / sequence_SO=supercontig / SO=protein_coding / is_pseudo=false